MSQYPFEVNGAPVPCENGKPVKVDVDAFNLCSECGAELTECEDGFGTTHGTCSDCLYCDD